MYIINVGSHWFNDKKSRKTESAGEGERGYAAFAR
jgi:hypothetical protein